MPLLDSFKVDHTRMHAPAVRVAKTMTTPKGDTITVFNVKDQSKIPELNEYQCGTYLMHSLAEAQEIAQNVLTRKVAVNKNEELTLDESLLNA